MSKFRVMIAKKDGKPVGIRAAQVNGKIINIALRDEPKEMTAKEALKIDIPSLADWMAIHENIEAVNKALKRAGGKELSGWYWSSSVSSSGYHWYVNPLSGNINNHWCALNYMYVRPMLTL